MAVVDVDVAGVGFVVVAEDSESVSSVVAPAEGVGPAEWGEVLSVEAVGIF